MKVTLSKEDQKSFQKLLEANYKNINISDMLLTAFCYVDFIDQDFVNNSISEGLNEEQAIIKNIKENFADDKDIEDLDNHISLKCLEPNDFICEYFSKLSNLNVAYKNYKFKMVNYEPYQLFAYDDIDIKDNNEISKVGYFKEKFSYLALFEKSNMWMSLNPNEINTMKPYIDEAKGSVLVLGLGMGYVQYMLSKKKDVKSITVVEKNRDNIIFFNKFIAPIFKDKKINIIEDDAIKFVDQFNHYDYIFADLWFTPEDGIEYYLKLNKIEVKRSIKIHYWLENGLKQMKRRYLVELINESMKGYDDTNYTSNETIEDRVFKELYKQTKNLVISSYDDIKELLK